MLSADQILSALRKLELLDVEGFANEDLKAVAEETGANRILQGSLSKAGDTFRIESTLQDILSGETISSVRTEGKGEESIFSMVDELTKKIKIDLNMTQEQIASDLIKNWEKSQQARSKHISTTLKEGSTITEVNTQRAFP